jgi:hypothetical protein
VARVGDTIVSFQIVRDSLVLSRYREWSVPEAGVAEAVAAQRMLLSRQVGPEGLCDAGSDVYYYRGREVFASIRLSPAHRAGLNATIGVREMVFDERWLDSLTLSHLHACRFTP